jgi:hypothetical protein
MAWTIYDARNEWQIFDSADASQILFCVRKQPPGSLELLRLLMAAPAAAQACRHALGDLWPGEASVNLVGVVNFLDGPVPPEIPHYEVVVGNVGKVYDGYDGAQASRDYWTYVNASALQTGRAGGEDVTLLRNGVISRHHTGKNNEEND